MLGWCSNCARLVLKLCSAGAQIVLGWCSNCARLVLKLCFSCGPSGARFVVPLDLSLPGLVFFIFFAIIFAVSLCFFLCFFVLFLCLACASFGGWYLRVNEVLRLRVRMGSGFRI